MDPVTQMILLITGLLILGTLGEVVFSRTGIPDIIWLVSAGILAGPVLDLVSADMLRPILPFFGAFALVTILSSGGLHLKISEVADSAPRALELALSGFFFSMLAMAAFLWSCAELGYIRQHGWMIWLMLGAVLGGSSSVVIIPTMAAGKVEARVADLLSVESSITDALSVVLALVCVELVLSGDVSVGGSILALLRAVGIGLGLGLLGGFLFLPIAYVIHGKTSAFPVLLASLLLIYALIGLAGGNGALGILAASLLIGNSGLVVRRLERYVQIRQTERLQVDENAMAFHGQVIFLVKSFFFFLIGLMFPLNLKLVVLGIAGALVLLVFRVPATWLSLWGADFNRRDKGVVAVAMPRGLAAGVLSAMPLQMGVPGAENFSSGVFAVIVASILLFALGFSLVNRSAKEKRGGE